MKTVLLVDDEEDICLLVKENLEEIFGVSVDYVHSGESAIRKIRESSWTLAIVDLKLPTGVSGIDVIRAAKQIRPEMQVVAITGYVDEELKKETESFNVREYLEKPGDICDTEKLTAKLKPFLP